MTNNIPTLELIKQRHKQGSRPGQRKDDCILALVIEGGGMRGVVSGGMVSALEALGLREAFDAVYGSSSGAMAGAYFLARQARFGTTIYYDCLANRKFIRKSNLLSSRPIMNTSYLLDNVCRQIRPLRAIDVLHSDIPLKVIGSSTRQRAPVVMSDFVDDEDVFQALRCSITVPGIAGPAVEYKGDHLFDSALYESIPLRSARRDGATHVLVLLTRAAGTTRTAPGRLQSALLRFRLKDQPEHIVTDWLQSHHAYSREMNEIVRAERGAVPGLSVRSVQLGNKHANVSQLETRREILFRGAREGFRQVMNSLGNEDFVLTQVLGGSFPSGQRWPPAPPSL